MWIWISVWNVNPPTKHLEITEMTDLKQILRSNCERKMTVVDNVDMVVVVVITSTGR